MNFSSRIITFRMRQWPSWNYPGSMNNPHAFSVNISAPHSHHARCREKPHEWERDELLSVQAMHGQARKAFVMVPGMLNFRITSRIAQTDLKQREDRKLYDNLRTSLRAACNTLSPCLTWTEGSSILFPSTRVSLSKRLCLKVRKPQISMYSVSIHRTSWIHLQYACGIAVEPIEKASIFTIILETSKYTRSFSYSFLSHGFFCSIYVILPSNLSRKR
ncbi:hypothetical protein KP509_07G014600 [Ceratopteris richardii]|uniref:Uncharacterized protein n=1 Tax=Ceratopteris richardii TaxID=49495 RepID=A0A8T2UED8_CERRI|nr:hypothetical protein KP509_07G014600 [Ceratopteris richardii]